MNLQEYFDSIDVEKVHQFLDDKQEEHLQLDFKEVNESGMTRDDRKTFAKAMSGFANSSGGIIVWGVKACKQNGEEHDVACGLPMVEDTRLLVNKLNEHTGSAISPIVEGIRHMALLIDDSGRGFVKTLIPESDSGPHMSNLEKRYYKRSGDSFYKMEHYDVADMFGKRKSPSLELVFTPRIVNHRTHVTISIYNKGRGSAHSSYVGLNLSKPYEIRRSTSGPDNAIFKRAASEDYMYVLCASPEQVIHPKTSLTVARITAPYPTSLLPSILEVEYQISAEHMPLLSGTSIVDVSGLDLLNK